MEDIWQTALDSETIPIKKNVRFWGRLWIEKFQLYQMRNDRLSAIIYCNMRDIWKTELDS